MAVKTLSEALDKALLVGPISGIKQRLKNELRDYISHEIDRYKNANKCKSVELRDFQELVLEDFFYKIFPKE